MDISIDTERCLVHYSYLREKGTVPFARSGFIGPLIETLQHIEQRHGISTPRYELRLKIIDAILGKGEPCNV